MVTTEVTSAGTSLVESSSSGETSILDKDAFLTLLLTQLENQDPMNPMSDTEFVAQLAQFSSLEELQQLGDSFDTFGKTQAVGEAFALIGKQIDYLDPETLEVISGTVDQVSIYDGVPVLGVGSEMIELASIITVY